jgi:DNA-binding beta-propeller fold protein YncE
MPPEEPKIKWVGWIRGEIDVITKDSKEKMLDAIVGKNASGIFLGKPYGVHVTGGKIFVSDTGAGKVAVFDTIKQKAFYIGEEGQGSLSKPIGVTTDRDGNIYVADAMLARVLIYDKNSKFVTAIGKKDDFERPVGVGINNELGRLYVVDTKKHNVFAFSKKGEMLFQFGRRGNREGEFNFPTNIFIGKDGRVYVTDGGNFRVQIFDADGKFLSSFGKVGDSSGMFARPKGIAVDSEGHIYVVDAAFNNVQIFNEEKQLLLFFGEMGQQQGRFWLPAGIWIDEDDKIYVADQYNRRINIFQYMGEKYKKSLQGQK